ncbi:MAG TPA: molybdenum cofactor guanylyltransferase MobA [Methylocella sp.]|nr:molybdenum cofactor guanylyltransferase MobA [Methylocella sp.]
MRTNNCFGILLAGGRARRMGGGDKALRQLGGVPLLAHAIAALQPQCEGLVLSANGDPERFAGFDLPVVADDVPGFMGPLAGILAGLDWIAARRPDVALAISVPADTPFLPGDLATRLMDAKAKDNALIACARSGGKTHQAVAVWPVSMRFDLRHALVVENIRKVEAFLQNYSRAIVEWPTLPYDPFFNANDPSDLAAAEAILTQRDNRLA